MSTPITPKIGSWTLVFTAWLIALVATLGALFVGEVMGQTPCLLCWYQRIFMFPLAIVLGVSAIRDDKMSFAYGAPLSVMGMVVAGYHVLVYAGWVVEGIVPCGQGPSCTDAKMTIFGSIPLPVLSFVAFAAITALLITSRRNSRT